MTEADIQRQIRIALSGYGTYFRANVGQAYTGSQIIRLEDDVLIKNARVFNTGLPNGFPDLFGFTLKNNIPVFTAIEVKAPKGRLRKDQKDIIEFLKSRGVLVGVAHSKDEAIEIVSR